MANFGHPSAGSLQSSPIAGDRKFSLQATMPEDGVVTSIGVDLQNSGSDIQGFRAGIYGSSGGNPGALLASSDTVLLAPGTLRAFVSFPFSVSTPTLLLGQVVFLTFQSGLTGGNAAYWYDSGSGRYTSNADTFSDGLSNPYGTLSSDLVSSIAIYGSYTPSNLVIAGVKRVYTYAGSKL